MPAISALVALCGLAHSPPAAGADGGNLSCDVQNPPFLSYHVNVLY